MAALRPSPRFAERLLARTRLASPTSPRLLPMPTSQICSSSARFYSSDAPPPPPPLLKKFKSDLKAAMRAKDAPRLSAIRSILNAVTNASKTKSPITSDVQLVSLLRKSISQSVEARDSFANAGRDDLVYTENAEIAVLEEYLAQSGVKTLSPEALAGVVAGAVEAAGGSGGGGGGGGGAEKAIFGAVMKTLFAPGGPLDGVDVDKAQVAELVKESVAK
ncbi:GatB/YqeY domain-containing protein [Annulohypoxylon truncatum]|uniref:GatB/YqeY domain-containing protein n=1 Tax=Annulohypoxylon truncatum TaxID=327061 RepID=UPI002007E785|nr:GatB/YqeY domain-containing protein [Annulohypoxylon truncatum]KAI1205749.1 GatB/YqeY domain-containing protein [Annulohypoxylon truncatum]